MKEVALKEFLELFDESVHDKILQVAKGYNAEYVVCFENQNFDSSSFGKRTAMPIGPNNTYKTLEEVDGKWINDMPSQRKYATVYAKLEDIWKKVDTRS